MRWELMDRYLAGECSPAERDEAERWLAEAPHRRSAIEYLAGPGEADLKETRDSVWSRLEHELPKSNR
jgi:hypothetical protein